MRALKRLYQSGMTRASVAEKIGASTQLVGLYERDQRFPGREKYTQIVQLAESRGLTLLARDFIDANGLDDH